MAIVEVPYEESGVRKNVEIDLWFVKRGSVWARERDNGESKQPHEGIHKRILLVDVDQKKEGKREWERGQKFKAAQSWRS